MDTLGTITPQFTPCEKTERRTEALERLRYLGQTGGCGLLSGPVGSGKSWLLSQLARQLQRNGIGVAQINLAGLAASELPFQVASRLGLGIPPQARLIELWSTLQDYAEALRGTPRQIAFLLDHVERAEDSAIAPLERLIDLFSHRSAWLLATRPDASAGWQQFAQHRSWLRIELLPLELRETAQLFSREVAQRDARLRLQPDTMTAVQEVTAGEIRRLHQLAEVTVLAAEAEDREEIDRELILSIAAEVR
jgi:hypothetical protein